MSVEESRSKALSNGKKGHYIFFAPTVGGVGGAQLYLSAKVAWLESIGWNVSVFYTDKKKICLANLKKFEGLHVPHLTIRFSTRNNKRKKNVCNYLLNLIGYQCFERVVIESYSFETALWGEYIARTCKGKHFCYVLGEYVSGRNVTGSMKEFLRFKLRQDLLFGISPLTIPSVLPEASGEKTALKAEGCSQFNAPVIDDDRLHSIPADGFTILSVGRLEKPYMKELFKNVCQFSINVTSPVNFVIVGDTSSQNIKDELFSILKSSANLRVIFWGYAFPIPRQLYEMADVFVGCAGSANLSFKERVPTITVDVLDHKGIGLLGETTENRLYRNDKEPPVEIVHLLTQVYDERTERREKRKLLPPIVETPNFTKHHEIIEMKYNNEYYPVERVKNLWWLDFAGKFMNNVIGESRFLYLKKIKSRFNSKKR